MLPSPQTAPPRYLRLSHWFSFFPTSLKSCFCYPTQSILIFSAARPKAPSSSLDLLSVHVCQRFPSTLPTVLKGLPHCPLLLRGHLHIYQLAENVLRTHFPADHLHYCDEQQWAYNHEIFSLIITTMIYHELIN